MTYAFWWPPLVIGVLIGSAFWLAGSWLSRRR